jgi:hypothetical protein
MKLVGLASHDQGHTKVVVVFKIEKNCKISNWDDLESASKSHLGLSITFDLG